MGDGGGEGLEDLCGEGGAGDSTDGGGGVVSEVEFVVVGKGAELVKDIRCEEGGGVEVGGVVDGGDVNEIVDWLDRKY